MSKQRNQQSVFTRTVSLEGFKAACIMNKLTVPLCKNRSTTVKSVVTGLTNQKIS